MNADTPCFPGFLNGLRPATPLPPGWAKQEECLFLGIFEERPVLSCSDILVDYEYAWTRIEGQMGLVVKWR